MFKNLFYLFVLQSVNISHVVRNLCFECKLNKFSCTITVQVQTCTFLRQKLQVGMQHLHTACKKRFAKTFNHGMHYYYSLINPCKSVVLEHFLEYVEFGTFDIQFEYNVVFFSDVFLNPRRQIDSRDTLANTQLPATA